MASGFSKLRSATNLWILMCSTKNAHRSRFVTSWTPIIRNTCLSTVLILPWTLGTGTIQTTPPDQYKFVNSKSVIEELDRLHSLGHYKEEYSYLCQLLKSNHSNANNGKLLWRLARAAYLIAQEPGLEKNRRSKLIDDALGYIQRALQTEDENPEAHKWYAVIAGVASRGFGLMKNIRGAITVKLHAETALRFQPHDAMAHHIMAVWCYHVAALNWIERQAILFLCPSFPDASYEEALSHFEKAEILCPGSASCMELVTAAKCYLRFHQKDKSVMLLYRAKNLSPRTVEDEMFHSEATKMLKDLEKTLV